MDHEAKAEYARQTLKGFVQNVPGLQKAVGDPGRVDDFLARLRRDSIVWNGLKINLDVIKSAPDDPVLIFHPGMSGYSRLYLCFLGLLAEKGFNIIGIDRPGHGFSDGEVGDATVEDMAEITALAVGRATERFNRRIGMFGSSMGGMITFYLLPELGGVKSAICHNWHFPGTNIDPKAKWSRPHAQRPIARLLLRLGPRLSFSMKHVFDKHFLENFSDSEHMVRHMREYEKDPLLAHKLTLRTFLSFMGGFSPTGSYAGVHYPVMGLIGQRDGLVPLEKERQWWDMAALAKGRLEVVPDAGHLLFFDDCGRSLDIVAGWFAETL